MSSWQEGEHLRAFNATVARGKFQDAIYSARNKSRMKNNGRIYVELNPYAANRIIFDYQDVIAELIEDGPYYDGGHCIFCWEIEPAGTWGAPARRKAQDWHTKECVYAKCLDLYKKHPILWESKEV